MGLWRGCVGCSVGGGIGVYKNVSMECGDLVKSMGGGGVWVLSFGNILENLVGFLWDLVSVLGC